MAVAAQGSGASHRYVPSRNWIFGYYLSVSMYLISISPFSAWSLSKWCLLSTCLIFLWKIGFLATEIALVLSHMRGTLSNLTPKSLMVCTI
jgi:hypothetical protein